MSFYNFVSDPNVSSLEDNRIKNDVNNLRSLINSTSYKTRFVIVLVADGPINHNDLEERLVNIRRGTNFDSKGLYFLPGSSSRSEIQEFARILLSTLHPTSIEYYRDLSKHARRKRNRNTVPQPTLPPTQGTSLVLSLPGWNVRYEFKLAVFAEQRQEMNAACRNYETAYEILFSGELFESMPVWSARFNEVRMLADVIVIRIIRCLLWSSQSAPAVKWWVKHKDRMRDLVDRRGKGTATYGWEAWCSIWSKTMAELIARAEVFLVAGQKSRVTNIPPVQLLPGSDAALSERQSPWEYLHHEGYWLKNVSDYVEARRQHTMQIPPEDRVPEGASNAPSTKSAQMYETYLVPDPAREYAMLEIPEIGYTRHISDAIDNSIQAFQARSQFRMIELLQQRLSSEHAKAKDWSRAINGLKSLWSDTSWRHQGWWSLLFQSGELLLKVANEMEDYEMCLRLVWEMGCALDPRQLSMLKLPSDPVSTAVDLRTCLPQLTPMFAFAADTGHVGESIAVQLSLSCSADTLPFGLQISELKVVFDGGINPILLTSLSSPISSSEAVSVYMTDVQLSEQDSDSSEDSKRLSRLSTTSPTIFSGQADLSFAKKGNKIFNLQVVPREAGQVSVSSVVLLVTNGIQELALDARDFVLDDGIWWELRNERPVSRTFGCHRDVTSMNILPKPPKVEVNVLNLAKAYYTNENVELLIELVNKEDENVQASFDARLISPARGRVSVKWTHDDQPSTLKDGEINEAILPTIQVKDFAAQKIQSYAISVTGLDESVDHEIELKVSYVLASNPSTSLVKQVTIDLSVIRPFEASTIFQPRYHEEDWPDFFGGPDASDLNRAHGLKQRYIAKADVGCFAQETLLIRSMELRPRRIVGGAVCTASTGRLLSASSTNGVIDSTIGVQIPPEKTSHFAFDVELQKIVLGDRSPVALDCVIDINWSRVGSDAINTSTLPLAKFLAPMSEPRVLLQASEQSNSLGTYLLTYTIENPSVHFLTFNITMLGGEDIAFSGPKVRAVSLVPISRYHLQYRIYTQKKRDWVKVQLDVLDAVFQQHLRIQPATENVRVDKQGVIQFRAEGK